MIKVVFPQRTETATEQKQKLQEKTRKMLKQVIILAVIAYASCLSVDECRFGESYWCASIVNAKKCSSVDHCMTTVWKNQKLAGDSSDTCLYCENIIKDVQTFIDNKQNQDQIKKFMDAACSVVPDASLAKQCQDTVDQDLPLLITMIDQAMDPQTICASFGLCTGLKDLVQHPKPAVVKPLRTLVAMEPIAKMQKAVAEDYCADCKKFMADIKAIITDPTEEKQIETLIEQQLCAQMGGLKDTCNEVVEAYVPELMSMLAADVDPATICAAMGFCNSTVDAKTLMAKFSKKVAVKLRGSTQCVLCEFVMSKVDQLLTENATKTEILDALDKVCSYLPSTIKDECTNFVNTYGPAVIMLLESELTPQEVCSALGLCAKDKVTAVVKADEYCSICEVIMQYLDTLLEAKPTVTDIEDALDKVCNFLPKSMSSECDSIVTQYTPMIIQIVAQEATPAQVCEAIGLCKSGDNKKVVESKIVPQQAPLLGVSECSWGPAYWCMTRENAKKCGAVAHCENHVWK